MTPTSSSSNAAMTDTAGNRFFIKDGYTPNPVQRTFDATEIAEYWNEDRIRTSSQYQYHVYDMAARLIRKHRFASVLDVGSGPPTKVKMLIEPECDNITLLDQPTTRPFVEQSMPDARFVDANLEECDVDLGERYDLIICADVLEHLLDPNACVDFIRRSLSDRGLAVLSTPERDIQRGLECMISGHPAHVREWNRREFRRYIESRDLVVVDHKLMPVKRLRRSRYALSRLFSWVHRSTELAGCQAIICRPA